MRDDLMQAAYAVALGYSLHIDGDKRPFVPASFIKGIPHDGLSFERGRVSVWNTARGWRHGKLTDEGRYLPPTPDVFHKSLVAALDAGALLFDPEPAAPRIYTAFCQSIDGEGTIWIGQVEAPDRDSAVIAAVADCAHAWEYLPEHVHCLGLAHGKVDICHWADLNDD